MKRMFFFILVFPLFFSVQSCGSSAVDFFDGGEVVFYLPEYGGESSCLPELLYWEVRSVCGSSSEIFTLPPSSCSFSLRIPHKYVCSITALPVTRVSSFYDSSAKMSAFYVLSSAASASSACAAATDSETAGASSSAEKLTCRFFKPAGCIYPYKKELSWLHGFSAQILADFYSHSLAAGTVSSDLLHYAQRFNWNKLLSVAEIKSCGGSISYNPWSLDRTAVLEAVSGGTFSASYINLKNCLELSARELNMLVEKKLESSGRTLHTDYSSGSGIEIFSSYVPENLSDMEGRKFCQKYGVQNVFLYMAEGSQCFYVFAAAVKGAEISLALNSIPL